MCGQMETHVIEFSVVQSDAATDGDTGNVLIVSELTVMDDQLPPDVNALMQTSCGTCV